MKLLGLLMALSLLAGCASTDMSTALDRGRGKIPTYQFADAKTVQEVRALKPQAQPPIKVAVLPVRHWQSVSLQERQMIESWGEQLKRIGFIESLTIIPDSLIPRCNYQSDSDCYLDGARLAGARMGADALLFLSDSTVTDSYVNPTSILNLTIVGMWIAPAHHRDSYSVYEASLFDIDNGYLYTVAEGYGEYKTIRPFMYVDYNTGQKEARLSALNALGEKLLAAAQRAMAADNSNRGAE